MSAFICGPDHIKALAIFAAHDTRLHGMNVDPKYFRYDGGDARMEGRPSHEVATYYANILYCENIRSVQTRYPKDTFDDLPGLIHKPEMLEVSRAECAEQYNDIRFALQPVDILKMCACLAYQCCETDDWESTLAYRLLNKIRLAAISLLPGYEDAPWEYDKPQVTRRRAA